MTDRMTAAGLKRLRKSKGNTWPAPRIDREGPIHMACLNWLKTEFPNALIHHSPNEWPMNQRSKGGENAIMRIVAKAKRMGMLPGFSDILVIWRGHIWLIEVKAEGNTESQAQREVGALAERNGARYACVYSLRECQEVVRGWREAAA